MPRPKIMDHGRAPDRKPDQRPRGFDHEVRYKPPTLPHGPWIFFKMIDPPRSSVPNGSYLALKGRDGSLLARGILNRQSEIAFRRLGGPDAPEDIGELLALRIKDAVDLRTRVLGIADRTDAWRLLNSEGDFVSGLVIDRYAGTCVVSVYSIGFIAAAEVLERELLKLPGVRRVLFRSDERTQKLEGFRLPPPPPGIEETVREGGVRYRVDLSEGHKTGLFLDQRDQRAMIAGLAKGRRVLDLCTNAGGFALAAKVDGAAREVIGIDLDETALERARANARLNKAAIEFRHADLFPFLRERTDAAERFDIVVLDPPKLAKTRKDAARALATYREMNALALKAVVPGGLLLSCSCSGSIGEGEFIESIRRAASEVKRSVQVLSLSGAAADHPVALEFPEGRYLKAALLHVG